MRRDARRLNRVVLGLIGLVLVAVGLGAVALWLRDGVAARWPYTGRDDVLLSEGEPGPVRRHDWWWPVVIGVLALIVLCAAVVAAGPGA